MEDAFKKIAFLAHKGYIKVACMCPQNALQIDVDDIPCNVWILSIPEIDESTSYLLECGELYDQMLQFCIDHPDRVRMGAKRKEK